MADPTRKSGSGWLGRGLGSLRIVPGHARRLRGPRGPASGDARGVSLRADDPPLPAFRPGTGLGGPPRNGATRFPGVPADDVPAQPAEDPPAVAARRSLIEDLAELSRSDDPMRQFVRRNALETYVTIGQVREIARAMARPVPDGQPPALSTPTEARWARELSLVADLIAAGFGTRIFYLSTSGFDTHANQSQGHQQVLNRSATRSPRSSAGWIPRDTQAACS